MAESIRVENVTKEFTLRYHRTFKQVTVALAKGNQIKDTKRAVDDVSFTVSQGESIGLMGLNGSGKSTLLKMINGVMRPDEGRIRTRGRIAGLIATGAGFHPQLSGKENILLNAAILGMSEKEIARKFDAIVDFADLDDQAARQTEVGHYSSGESARLGLLHRHPRRLRHLPRRRGARGGRQALQEEVPGEDGGGPRQRPHPLLRLALRRLGQADVHPRPRPREGPARLRRRRPGGHQAPRVRRPGGERQRRCSTPTRRWARTSSVRRTPLGRARHVEPAT